MTVRRATFSPAEWSPAKLASGVESPGAWVKELRRPALGDSYSLLRLDAGSSFDLTGKAVDRILVLEGEAHVERAAGAEGGKASRRGAYLDVFQPVSSVPGCLMLLIGGPQLGDPAEDVFSPAGWSSFAPGVWSRSLTAGPLVGDMAERVIGIAYIEPGGTAALHEHITTHIHLYLDGEADDEMVYPDGTREVVLRGKGDFVEHDYPIRHRTFSRPGCMIFFDHEPVTMARPV